MDFITTENLYAYWHLILLGSIIFYLFFGKFLFEFLIPSFTLHKNLKQAIRHLKTTKSNGATLDITLIGNKMKATPKLGHCWTEFSQTLHKQTAPDEWGQERVVCWRSTVPAEVFFNVETLIAVELKTEYFKHQPGILTGVGIIGTFIGLLRGLSNFSVSSNPELVRRSLDTLISGVTEAFYVSAVAIFLAMLTTFLEKLIVTGRIKQVEELCQLLDSLFEGGAGEEYLSRLVKAGESSATQTAQLKDALVSDLKEMLSEMIRQQTEAIANSFTNNSKAQIATTEQSGDRIAKAISDSLSEPLQSIAAAVNTTTDNNGEVVTRALNEALVTFSQQMKDMFGGQMGEIGQLLQQTTVAMQATVARFDQLSNNLGDAGKNAADAMTGRLEVALESMEARQMALNNTMTEFVGQLRDMVNSSQSETNKQIQQTIAALGEQLATMTEQLQKQTKDAADSHQLQQKKQQQHASAQAQELTTQMQSTLGAVNEKTESTISNLNKTVTDFVNLMARQAQQANDSQQLTQQQLAEQATRIFEHLSLQVQALTIQANGALESMQSAVASMRDVTKDNTQRMENSAATLSLAASDFAKAGNSVVNVTEQTGIVASKMAVTAITLDASANTLQTALSDYKDAGQIMGDMIEALKATVEAAKKEATVSQSLVDQIKQSADQLLQAQSSVDDIFKAVCDELANAHQVFANNVVTGLQTSNTAYQQELHTAVSYLKTAIEELGDVAEKIPERR